MRRLPQNQHADDRNASTASAFPSRPSTDSLSAQPATSANPSPAHAAGGLMQKNNHISDVLNRARESVGESWDDDFAEDITLSKFGRAWMSMQLPLKSKLTSTDRKEDTAASEDQDQKTLRPSRSPSISLKPLPEPPSTRAVSDSYVEDYSDVIAGEDETGLTSKFADLKVIKPVDFL